VGHKALFSAITRGLPRAERETIVARYYAPHRSTVERAVTGQVRAGRSVVHVGIHSFTPELDGEIRNADIGLLYDPKREQEKEFCRAWAEALRASPKGWRVRLNYPYRGDSDGLTTSLRKMFAATRYLGIEVECNQRAFLHPAGPKQAVALRRDLLASLRGVIKL
jgi:predicted N-formylglutamate amidohydrolase